jgi:hypothetical protein
MSRPKHVSDEQLFLELNAFWFEECHEVPTKLNSRTFSLYLQHNGYSASDSALRHNAKLMERIHLLKEEAKPKPGSQSACQPVVPNKPGLELSYDELLKKFQQMQDFICHTYVNGICCHLVKKELSVSMDSPVQAEAAERDIITAGTNPFSSPVVKKLADLFYLEDENE